MTTTSTPTTTSTQRVDLTERAAGWLEDFESALGARDREALRDLFAEDSYWRDLVSFTWDAQQFHTREALLDELLAQVEWAKPSGFVLDPKFRAPMANELAGDPVVEFFFTFETSVGTGQGYVIGVEDDDAAHGARAFILFTYLSELRGGEPRSLETRHPGLGYEPEWPGQTWGQHRERRLNYDDREPEVLVVGGGQAGVTVTARLDNLGIDALVVDKHERAGDSWRKRYETLALHTPTDMSDFPFFPFPKTFPKYLPKDKYADYIESYVTLLDLNYWTSTEFLGGEFDEETMTWTARVRRDGEVRVLHPKHIVVTVGGAGGRPNLPSLPGLDTFEGTVIHSSKFRSGVDHPGSKAAVVGVGTSAHDIALDLFHNGCEVQMVQRGSTSVVDVEVANVAYAEFADPEIPQHEADVRTNAKFLYPLLVKFLKKYTTWTQEVSAELLSNLERVGMKLDIGEDDTGWQMKFARYAGGYYLNVGASDVIVDGGIKITPYDDIDRFVPEGVRMKDGTVRELDLVVLATGYQNLTTEVRDFFGDEVADRVGDVAGLGPDGERRNFCKPTPQPHLWFVFGGIIEGRRSASWLTLQIKANLMGLVPSFVRGDDLRLKPFRKS